MEQYALHDLKVGKNLFIAGKDCRQRFRLDELHVEKHGSIYRTSNLILYRYIDTEKQPEKFNLRFSAGKPIKCLD